MLLIVGYIILLLLLLVILGGILNLSDLLAARYVCVKSQNQQYFLGPATWQERLTDILKDLQQDSMGDRLNNISSSLAISVPTETVDSLVFSEEFNQLPKDLSLCNYGDAGLVFLYANWLKKERPMISGGPLEDCFQFVTACFIWGANDAEGSEHTIDGRRYAMELQVVNIKVDTNTNEITDDNAVLIVSYFFDVTPSDNSNLEPLVDALKKIRQPRTRVNFDPVPLASFIPTFSSKYFLYCRSPPHTPPGSDGVTWIVRPEPLGISARQLRKFRKLHSLDGPIDINTRPVQRVNCRNVFYYD